MVLFVHLQVSHPNHDQVVSAWCYDFTQIICWLLSVLSTRVFPSDVGSPPPLSGVLTSDGRSGCMQGGGLGSSCCKNPNIFLWYGQRPCQESIGQNSNERVYVLCTYVRQHILYSLERYIRQCPPKSSVWLYPFLSLASSWLTQYYFYCGE